MNEYMIEKLHEVTDFEEVEKIMGRLKFNKALTGHAVLSNRYTTAAMIDYARGVRSVSKFSEEVGVSPVYLSRVCRGLAKKPLSSLLIEKIVAASEGVVSTELCSKIGLFVLAKYDAEEEGSAERTDPRRKRMARAKLAEIQSFFTAAEIDHTQNNTISLVANNGVELTMNPCGITSGLYESVMDAVSEQRIVMCRDLGDAF